MDWFGSLEVEYKVTIAGILVTAIMSAISLFYTVKNDKVVHYVDSITQNRVEWNRVKDESKGRAYEKETYEFDIWELKKKYNEPDYKKNRWKRFCINSKARIKRIGDSSSYAVFIFFIAIIIFIVYCVIA